MLSQCSSIIVGSMSFLYKCCRVNNLSTRFRLQWFSIDPSFEPVSMFSSDTERLFVRYNKDLIFHHCIGISLLSGQFFFWFLLFTGFISSVSLLSWSKWCGRLVFSLLPLSHQCMASYIWDARFQLKLWKKLCSRELSENSIFLYGSLILSPNLFAS